MLLKQEVKSDIKLENKSEGIELLESSIEPKKEKTYDIVNIEDILKKISIKYSEETDTFLLNIDSNLIIKSNNISITSSKDIVLLSGEAQNKSGKIHLNPVLSMFRRFLTKISR